MDNESYKEEKRKFSNKWLALFPWVTYDNIKDLMFCKICLQYSNPNEKNVFIKGSSSFNINSLNTHQTGPYHQRSINNQIASERTNLLKI